MEPMHPIDLKIAGDVEKYGWSCMSVHETETQPGFSYTIGLGVSFGHPDILMFALDREVRYGVLSTAVAEVRAGCTFKPGERTGKLFANDQPAAFGAVHPSQWPEHFGIGRRYYRSKKKLHLFSAIQLFWADKAGAAGKFPFEPGCHPGAARCQPRLDLVAS